MNQYGLYRISVCSPCVALGNPDKNVELLLPMMEEVRTSDVVVFPELGITGYSCGDLFRQQELLVATEKAVGYLARKLSKYNCQLVLVGAPVPVNNELFNCAIALNMGKVIGIIPKQNIPTYGEFYEGRWFRAANGNEPASVMYDHLSVPFGTDLLFSWKEMVVGVEICEDLWMPIPPSSYQALAGANMLVNLSASNETVAKCEYRTDLVKNQSGRCVAGYAYASAGPTESTTDLVFGGHCLIAENSHLLTESPRVGSIANIMRDSEAKKTDNDWSWHATADVDIQRLKTERRYLTSFGDARHLAQKRYRTISFVGKGGSEGLCRKVNARPFVPSDHFTLRDRCSEVFGIQTTGLARRLDKLGRPDVYIGISGGLDSTLALLVATRAYAQLGVDLKKIHGITMRGFGTTDKTMNNAISLMQHLGISAEAIDIRMACLQTFKDIRHNPFGVILPPKAQLSDLLLILGGLSPEQRAKGDLVFENVQARERTKILMSKGFVIGTGDMSELALGWCTYNGDHMSMYNPNCSIPKTLVKWLVAYVAEHESNKISKEHWQELRDTLIAITKTTISPELLPPDNRGEIEQSTETVLGPYELHDFFLANFVRNGFTPAKILFLASHAKFDGGWSKETIETTLKTFLKRFFGQQFKRSCVPDGPKVGSVSLSPRGDWRMPSDADANLWLKQLG